MYCTCLNSGAIFRTATLGQLSVHKIALVRMWKIRVKNLKIKKKKIMAPFYGWGSTASRLEPLRGGSLLFTTNTSKEQIL